MENTKYQIPNTTVFFTKHRIKFFILSAALVLFSLFSMFFWGLNLGIEFTGGTVLEVEYVTGRPDIDNIKQNVAQVISSGSLIQPTGENGVIVRTKELTVEERHTLLSALSLDGTKEIQEVRYSLVGPSIGGELRRKALIAIVIVLVAIILYLAFSFRKVSGAALSNVKTEIRSWHYGVLAIIALTHDIIIPTGIFAFLGSIFIDSQIDILFVTALLAILGYSVNDTIVVFDRVRENLRRNDEERQKQKKNLEEIVGESLNQTYGRSINTALTTLLVLLALFFIGGSATQNFALVLIIGVIAGTYSSIALATPLLVTIGNRKRSSK